MRGVSYSMVELDENGSQSADLGLVRAFGVGGVLLTVRWSTKESRTLLCEACTLLESNEESVDSDIQTYPLYLDFP